MTDEELIRQVEDDVLDQEYRHFDLLSRRSWLAVGHLFKVFGDIVRDLNRRIGVDLFSQARFVVNSNVYGLEHCLRWLLQNQVKLVVLPTENWKTLDNESTKFLIWGTKYSFLANEHTVWSRNKIRVEIDQANKRITFGDPVGVDCGWLVQQLEAQQTTIDDRAAIRPDKVLRADCLKWISDLQLSSTGLRGNYGPRSSHVTQAMEAWVSRSVLPTLDGSEDLNGFSLAEFRTFLSSLLPFCFYHCWFEDGADHQLGPEHPFGSQPLMMPMEEFLDWTRQISGLPKDAAQAIIEMLTFDPSRFHEHVIYRPFVVLADQTLFTSPRLWSLLNLERLLVGALNNSGRKNVYDHLINQIETGQIREIAAFLEPYTGWEVVCNRCFCINGKTIKPDFVIWEPKSDYILVIDYKHAMEVSGPIGVINQLDNFKEWKEKVGKYKDVLLDNCSDLNRIFPQRTTSRPPAAIDGLILSRWPIVLPSNNVSDIVITDWLGFRKFVSKQQAPSISSILTWTAGRPDIARPEDIKLVPKEICVGDWTYVYNTLAGN